MRTADADAIIAGPDIDLVVIATPNPTHAPLACAAIAAGKHVVIDKPLALDAGEGAVVAALAADRGRVLGVFHNRRWDGDFLTVRRLLDERALGIVQLYEARWRSEEHTSELQSLMRISYAVFCLKQKK